MDTVAQFADRLNEETTRRAYQIADDLGGGIFTSTRNESVRNAFEAGIHAGVSAAYLVLSERGLLSEADLLAAVQEVQP